MHSIEIPEDFETATFEQINLHPEALAQNDYQGSRIFIEVFSRRKSSRDNLLDCEHYELDIASVSARTVGLFSVNSSKNGFPSQPGNYSPGRSPELASLTFCNPLRRSLLETARLSAASVQP